MMEKLVYYETEPAYESPEVGCSCAALFEDGYYRGELCNIVDGKALVYFVDYGNSDEVLLEQVKKLKDEDVALPKLAIKCSLQGISCENEDWSDDLLELFSTMTVEKTLLCEFISKPEEENKYEVKLLDMGLPIVDKLLEISPSEEFADASEDVTEEKITSLETGVDESDGCIQSKTIKEEFIVPKIDIGSNTDVCVSVANDPTCFYCQKLVSSEDLPLLMDSIHEYCSDGGEKLLEPKVGLPCIAPYTDDAWYRGLVESVDEDKVTVHFVDYGNIEKVKKDQIYKILPEHLELPIQSFKCCLEVKPLESVWDAASCTRFEELTSVEEKMVLKVKKVELAENGLISLITCDLEIENKSVTEALISGGYAKTNSTVDQAEDSDSIEEFAEAKEEKSEEDPDTEGETNEKIRSKDRSKAEDEPSSPSKSHSDTDKYESVDEVSENVEGDQEDEDDAATIEEDIEITDVEKSEGTLEVSNAKTEEQENEPEVSPGASIDAKTEDADEKCKVDQTANSEETHSLGATSDVEKTEVLVTDEVSTSSKEAFECERGEAYMKVRFPSVDRDISDEEAIGSGRHHFEQSLLIQIYFHFHQYYHFTQTTANIFKLIYILHFPDFSFRIDLNR